MFGNYFKRFGYRSLQLAEGEPLATDFKETRVDGADEPGAFLATDCSRDALQRFMKRFHIRIVKNVVLVLLALHGVVMLVYPTPICNWRTAASEHVQKDLAMDPFHNPMVCDCGNSIKEAIAKGCRYDELATAWLPAHCRDEALLKQFVSMGEGPDGQWLHWRYPNQTGLVTDKEIEAFADDLNHPRFYSSGRWFVNQCIFYWRKQIRARVSGVIVEPRYNHIDYILQCADTFMRGDYGTMLTESVVDLHSSHL